MPNRTELNELYSAAHELKQVKAQLKNALSNLRVVNAAVARVCSERDSYKADAELWRWWSEHKAVEREYGYDCEDVPVTLHRVEGSVNDREWVKIAEGETLEQAVRAAMKGDQP
jgi:DNA repair ATPase RecN